MSSRLLANTRTICNGRARLFQVLSPLDQQQQCANLSTIAIGSTKTKDTSSTTTTPAEDIDNGHKSKVVPYTKTHYTSVVKRNRSLSMPRQQNYSMFTESQQHAFYGSSHSDNDNMRDSRETTSVSKNSESASKTRERLTNIRYFYADQSIDRLSDRPLVRLNPISMMYMGVSNNDNSHLLKTANYLRHELPIRLAHMIKEIRHLPFIIAVNPHILEIHERCIKQFHIFDGFDRVITSHEAEKEFYNMIFQMIDINKDLLGLLCDGFKESRRYINDEEYLRKNLTRILSQRLGIRLLCEHFIALNKYSEQEGRSVQNDNYVGIIHKNFSPKNLIEKAGRMTTKICMDKYGVAPKLKIDGHTNVEFPYLSLPLEYILPELLKNSFRATCENHKGSALPDVTVTISVNEHDCIIRIRDRGGGIPHDLCEKIFDYHFTTVSEEMGDDDHSLSTDSTSDGNGMGIGLLSEVSSSRGLAVMHGYGFGLPTSRAYAEYLGGSLTFQSMQGIGSDFYLRIALIDKEPGLVRI